MTIFGLNMQWKFHTDYGSYNYQRLIYKGYIRNIADMNKLDEIVAYTQEQRVQCRD